MTATELWFLKETMESGAFDVATTTQGFVVRQKHFGYDEVYIDIDTTRYLVKHKSWAPTGSKNSGYERKFQNLVFYVQKHKRPIDGNK